MTNTEDQQKFICPINRDTEKIYYNQRMIVDAKVLTEPRTWMVSKVNRLSNAGLINVTLAQDVFDKNKDYIELDEYGNVIGMWASYYNSPIIPTNPEDILPTKKIYSEITYSGIKPIIMSGGNYKKFTVNFFDDGELISFKQGVWKFEINGEDASDKVLLSTEDLEENQINVKFLRKKANDKSYNGDMFIGQILNVSFVSDEGISSTIEIEISSL